MGKTGLCLPGGGLYGAYQVGVFQALKEKNIQIDMIAGTSIGAINGAKIAQGDFDGLLRVWHSFSEMGFIRPTLKFYESFLSNKPLKRAAQEEFGDLRIGDLHIPIFITGTNLRTGQTHIFDSDTLVWEAILASSAFPGVFPPVAVEVNGQEELFTDGGVGNNTPMLPLIEAGATEIFIALLKPPIIPDKQTGYNIVTSVLRTLDIITHSTTVNDLLFIQKWNELIEKDILKGAERINAHLIALEERTKGIFSLSQKEVDSLVDKGYKDAMNIITNNFPDGYPKQTLKEVLEPIPPKEREDEITFTKVIDNVLLAGDSFFRYLVKKFE